MIDRNVLKDAIMYAFNEAMKEVGYSTNDIKPVKISIDKSYQGDLYPKLIVNLKGDFRYVGKSSKQSDELILYKFLIPNESNFVLNKYTFKDDIPDIVKKLDNDFVHTPSTKTVDEIENGIHAIEKKYDCELSVRVIPSRNGFPVYMSFGLEDINIDGTNLPREKINFSIEGETVRNMGAIWKALYVGTEVNINSSSEVESTLSKVEDWLNNTVIKNIRKALSNIKDRIRFVHDNEQLFEAGCDKIEKMLEGRGLRNPRVTYTPNFNPDMFLAEVEINSSDGFKTKYRIEAKDDIKSAMEDIYAKVRRNSNRFVKNPSDELSDIII